MRRMKGKEKWRGEFREGNGGEEFMEVSEEKERIYEGRGQGRIGEFM